MICVSAWRLLVLVPVRHASMAAPLTALLEWLMVT